MPPPPGVTALAGSLAAGCHGGAPPPWLGDSAAGADGAGTEGASGAAAGVVAGGLWEVGRRKGEGGRE